MAFRHKIGITLSALTVLGAAIAPANAQLTQILNPSDLISGTPYIAATNLIDISGISNFTNVNSTTDGTLTINYSGAMNKRTVGSGGGWATWGAPPNTVGANPAVLYSGALTRTLNFSQALSVFGVEIEPDPFTNLNFTMDFYSGASLIGSINRDAHGQAGARLLAASSVNPFDSVVITSSAGWAMGQQRYGLAAVPEPGSVALLVGAGVVGLAARRRRKPSGS